MSEPNGNLTLDPAGAMARLLERVDHMDRVITRLEALADRAAPVLAAASAGLSEGRDDRQAIDADLGGRLGRALSLAGRLTDDAAARAFESLLARVDDLEKLAGLLDQAPGLIGMLADMFDEWAAAQAERGIDLEKSLRQGLHTVLWLGQRVSEVELDRLGIFLRSDVLDPHALAVVGKTGGALAACHSDACEGRAGPPMGPVAALKALNDPDVQRSLGFLIRVAKCFGARIGEPTNLTDRPVAS